MDNDIHGQPKDPRVPGWFLALLIALTVLCCAGGSVWAISGMDDTDTAATAPTTRPAESVGKAPVSREPSGSFGDGRWRVGVDILPGKYRATVPDNSNGCIWARFLNPDDPDNSLDGNVVAGGSVDVIIDPKDAIFETHGCGVWDRKR